MRSKKNRGVQKHSFGSFRIIAGQWRSRRLNFPVVDGLRPTTDRVRETLFNWLTDRLDGAKGADLFAGSGSLGFEALSRGASHLTFVEQNRFAIQALNDNLELLMGKADVVHGDTLHWLAEVDLSKFDILFLDPPFRKGLLDKCLARLEAGCGLRPGALIYLEMEKERTDLPRPNGWKLAKEKIAGQVSYRLYEVA